jgi:UDPglucose 6-dehydrogenase
MDIPSAEMTKYASNAMLATRISFMNDIANLCEFVGADVDMVRKGMGTDARIGNKFLYAGCGYGGSCFPKDVRALAQTGRQAGHRLRIIEAVEEINRDQKNRVVEKLSRAFGGSLAGKTVALWGLSFKPETDDMREAPSLVVIEQLLGAGAVVQAFDPVAMTEARRRFGDRITFGKDMYAAVAGADALVLLTEWKQFRLPDWATVRRAMCGDVLIDGRNLYDPMEMQTAGFRYDRIGWKKP